MKVYHGSNVIIETIDLSKCRVGTDFGRGFYDLLVEQLMFDYQIDETQATDIFYNSETFTQLANETTELYKRRWQEIYGMLKKELKIER